MYSKSCYNYEKKCIRKWVNLFIHVSDFFRGRRRKQYTLKTHQKFVYVNFCYVCTSRKKYFPLFFIFPIFFFLVFFWFLLFLVFLVFSVFFLFSFYFFFIFIFLVLFFSFIFYFFLFLFFYLDNNI